jgi:hypothetical protein
MDMWVLLEPTLSWWFDWVLVGACNDTLGMPICGVMPVRDPVMADGGKTNEVDTDRAAFWLWLSHSK